MAFTKRLLLLASALAASAQSFSTTSLFVPVEYESNTFSATIAGSDPTATTYIFPPGCDSRPCGPVTLIQGPGTAIFNETDQPITTIYDCSLYPTNGDPTSASCTISSTSPGYAFPDPVTMNFPQNSGDAFPTYKAVVVAAGSLASSGSRASIFEPITFEPLTTSTTEATSSGHRATIFNPITYKPLTTSSMSGSETEMGSTTTIITTESSSTAVDTATVTASMPASTTPEASDSSSQSAISASSTSGTSSGAESMVINWTGFIMSAVAVILAVSFS